MQLITVYCIYHCSYHYQVCLEDYLVYMCVTDEKMDQRAAYMFLDKVKCYVKQDSSTLIIIKINFYKYTRQYYIVILKCQ